jgi:hypothetical protein
MIKQAIIRTKPCKFSSIEMYAELVLEAGVRELINLAYPTVVTPDFSKHL